MQGVTKLDRCRESVIQDPCYGLPEELNQPDAAEVSAPLWYQDDSLPGELRRKVTLTEIRMDQANNHLQL